jgi:ComEC/Rec2-related protein
LSSIKQKIQSFLLCEFYLFWAAGLTAGIYIGSRYNYLSPRIIASETVFVLLLVLLEVMMIRRLSKRFPLGSSLINLPAGSFQPDSEKNFLKFLVQIVIPFFILLVIGNSIISIYRYGQSKKILLTISSDDDFCRNDVVIEGRISDHPYYYFGSLNFLLETGSIYAYDRSGNLKNFCSINEPLNVRLDSTGTGSLLRDDYLRLRGDLKQVDPGESEIVGHDCLYFNVKAGNMEKIECRSLASKIFYLRGRFYRCIKNTFYRSLKVENACIAEALILGNKNNIPEYISEDFKDCGVYHLFAISGLHISFFISMIYILVRKIKPSFIAFWAAVILLAFYTFLTGGRASTLRASIVFIFVFLASNWDREYNNRFLLYLSYIIILLFNPCFFYDLGLWMSFGSMAAIIFIYPVVRKIAGRILSLSKYRENFIMKIGLMTFSIQAALFPILAYFFKRFSLISPVANILILPVFYILLFILIASSFTSILWPPIGCFTIRSSAVFFSYILMVVKTLSKTDFFIINFNDYHIKDIVIYYIIFLVILSAALIIIRKTSINESNRN